MCRPSLPCALPARPSVCGWPLAGIGDLEIPGRDGFPSAPLSQDAVDSPEEINHWLLALGKWPWSQRRKPILIITLVTGGTRWWQGKSWGRPKNAEVLKNHSLIQFRRRTDSIP